MKRTIALGLLLTAAGVALAVGNQSALRHRDYRSQLRRGDGALRADDTFVAIEAYSGAIALRPDAMLAYLRRGETYRRRAEHGDLELAARDLKKAADLDAAATRPLEELGDVSVQLQRYDRAKEAYERLLQLDDRAPRVEYKLALVRYTRGDVTGALASLDRALRLDDRLADAYYLRGLCWREKQRASEAIKAFEKAVSLAPALIPAREELADLYAAMDDRGEQIEQLQLLAALESDRPARHVALGLANARAHRWDAAVLTLTSAIERTRDSSLVRALGQVLFESSQLRSDPVELRRTRETVEPAASAPDAASATLLLAGRAALEEGDVQNAEAFLQQACGRFPIEPAALLLYATVAERQNHADAARRALMTYEALVRSDADDLSHALRIATLSLELNDPETAKTWIARGLARDPQNAQLLALGRRAAE